VRVLDESDPLGADHDVVIEALGALATVGSDAAVPTLAALARRRAWFGRAKLRTLKERAVGALVAIGTPRAEQALAEARQTGDRMLKKIVSRVQKDPAYVHPGGSTRSGT
jgi:hypothetical protein